MALDFVINNSWLIPLLPLVGAVIAGFFGARYLKEHSHWPIWIGVGTGAVLSLIILFGVIGRTSGSGPDAEQARDTGWGQSSKWYDWIVVGAKTPSGDDSSTADYHSYKNEGNIEAADGHTPGPDGKVHSHPFYVQAGAWIDPLSAVMLCVVTVIGFFITVFAKGYMVGEEGYFRFFAYLGLFIFAMTILVMGNNFIMLYLGWEGVGLCSYLLIGYYYEKPAAREAAKKAFLVNRVGDFGFGLGIMLIFLAFGTISFFGNGVGTTSGVLEIASPHAGQMTNFQATALQVIPFLLMLGAFGKSAQFPLYVWLPDAMEGPTPVSALIHAATMVTAGVYMIARCGALFAWSPTALQAITVIGAFTALFAATIALRQFDLKKVFAYSTISQLGYMFVGVGVMAPVAGVFHLVTHAFFKALLFLSSGVVMHAMGGVLDMRQMSGLKKVLPKTNILMFIGCLALAGCPLLSGFFSKDEIIGATAQHHWVVAAVLLLAAFITAYYTFRLYFRVFQGPLVLPEAPAADHGAHAADSDEHAHGADDHGHGAKGAHGSHGGHDAHHDADGGHHNHEPNIMMVPLFVLAAGALLAGYLNWPAEGLGGFLGKSPSLHLTYEVAMQTYSKDAVSPGSFGLAAPEGSESGPFSWTMLFSMLIFGAGLGLAYLLHLRDRARAERIAAGLRPLTNLLEAKYWVDEIYQALIIEPLRHLGRIFYGIDRFVVDGIVAAVSWIPQVGGWILRLVVQRGYLQGYAAAMLFGIVVILLLVFGKF